MNDALPLNIRQDNQLIFTKEMKKLVNLNQKKIIGIFLVSVKRYYPLPLLNLFVTLTKK